MEEAGIFLIFSFALWIVGICLVVGINEAYKRLMDKWRS